MSQSAEFPGLLDSPNRAMVLVTTGSLAIFGACYEVAMPRDRPLALALGLTHLVVNMVTLWRIQYPDEEPVLTIVPESLSEE